MLLWSDVLADALGDLGLIADQFWDMTWDEYDYAVIAHRNRIARAWEPVRALYTLVHNMFADKAKTAEELIPLYTDPLVATSSTSDQESDEDFFTRMVANNFFQLPTPKAEKNEMN